MDAGVYSGVITACVVVAAFFLLSRNRKIESVLAVKPTDLVSFSVRSSTADAQSAILRYAETSKLKVEYADNLQGVIVLGQNMGLTFHNGFWLPVYLTQAADGYTVVEIGIKSKSYQAQFALNIIRKKQADKLYKVITAQSRTPTNVR